ncbi:MAG TPA: flagellar biosynthetic protein FliQ [Opitutus sp.]|nr:flagellar biosynthetic protein FliQ [Opitutus sp.]
MNPELAVDLLKNTVIFALMVAGPFLVALLITGLISSLFQSVTSMQEQSLTFTPKLLVLALIAMLLGPWLLRQFMEFTVSTLTRMGTLGH